MFRPRSIDDEAWSDRCEYWAEQPTAAKLKQSRKKRDNRPLLVLSGHGARLCVDNGALIVQNGFTHYPQKREEWRFFSGEWRTPSRIIVLDGSGGITFHALRWLAERDIPLVQIDWRGNVVHVVGGGGYAIDRKLAEAQLAARTNGTGLKLSLQLIAEKINNSMATLLSAFTPSPAIERALQKLKREADVLTSKPPASIGGLLGIEGRAGFAYFSAWRSFPLQWKGTDRRPIPDDWRRIGQRGSFASGRDRPNQHATHPVNAMLNYTYAVLESQVRARVIGAGLDPTVGLFHGAYRQKPALVYDLMEPLRPLVDRNLLEFVQQTAFLPADFILTSGGLCRLSPQLARNVVSFSADSGTYDSAVAPLLSRVLGA
ncbi:MAG TPA: CRISPR-associated endonuclease Cas1 [Stellaceae bacterium]|nr:CRISPR-associated endonuclease Cas1 [Stellaceae bacterium]